MAREQEQQPSNINRICQGTEIIGNINTSGDIRLDGVLEGNISSKGKVVIGATGKTRGEIICRTTDIFGHVEGAMDVSEILSLKSTSVVRGNITTVKLNIEAGAVFNGTCSMPEQHNTTLPKKN